MSVAVSCGLVGGLWILDPQQNSSRISCCCPESRRSCGYISAGLVPSYAPAIHRWDRCWGGTDVGVGQLKALDLTFCGIWVCYPRDHSHFRQEAEPSLLLPHCLWLPARGRTCSPRVKERWGLLSKALRYQSGFKKQSRPWHLHGIWWITWAMNINTGPSCHRAMDPDMALIGSTGQDITWPLTS